MASTAFPSLSSTVAPPPSALWSAKLSVRSPQPSPVSSLAPIPPFSRAHTRRPQHLLPSLIASSCPPPYLAPYPTNEPWQNFVLGQGGSPELVNPYVVQSGDGRVAWGIPARNAQPAYIIQAFITNLMLSTLQGLPPHQVSAYDDLSVTLSFRPPSAAPSAPPALVVPLVRGSPYLTFIFPQGGPPATPVLKTIHAILSVEARGDSKYRVALNNGQTWLVYLSSPLALRQDGSSIVAGAPFTGTMRIALLPGNSPQREEALLDAHVATVPVGGRARVGAFRIKLSWRTQQWRKLAPGGTKTPLLMLSLPAFCIMVLTKIVPPPPSSPRAVHRRLRVFAHNPTPATSLRRHRSVSPSNDGTAAIRVSPDPAPAGLSSTRADGGWGESEWDSSSSSSGSSDGETGSLPTAQGNAASTAAGDPAASNQAAMAWTSASSSSAARAAQETVLSYPTIDGRAVGVKGAVWELKVPKTPTTWHSPRLSSDSQLMDDLRASLKQDVAALPPLTTASTYFFGKAAARAARLALIAEQVHDDGSLAAALPPLRAALTAWLDGTFPGNRLLYDPTWGGVVSEAGSRDKGADFGLGMYNDHHFHYGYFVYAAATVAKFDPMWGNRYRAQLAALVADYMSVNRTAAFPRLRHFDAYALHSWASGLFDFGDGRNQESFSEAANAYYAASLLAFTFGDLPLATLGATLAAVESVAAQVLMQVPVAGSSSSPPPSLSPAYEPVFADANRMLGMVWSTKRDAGLWFAAPAELDKRVGIQVLPVTPFLAHLFPDRAYARQLVEWAQPVLSGSGVTDEWRGFAWALQALYDPPGARGRIGALGAFDDGNSKTNMLWWLASNTP
ncbi:unnamed protein product [Closterium sp. Naga37s-1]|nr:unnamed protein product [Closterium sp. Naga37s-1]